MAYSIDPRKLTTGLAVRDVSQDDLEWILRAEDEAFTNPWHRSTYLGQLGFERAVFLAVESDGEPAGYSLSWTVVDEMHLLKIAVLAPFRRRGVGSFLIEAAEKAAVASGVRSSYLEVRASNADAQAFYVRHGYAIVGVRRHYYADTDEDAIVMSKEFAARLRAT